jgi:hypothetical protein
MHSLLVLSLAFIGPTVFSTKSSDNHFLCSPKEKRPWMTSSQFPHWKQKKAIALSVTSNEARMQT